MQPEKLLALVETHLRRTKESANQFGLRVSNDPSLVNKLRAGRNVRYSLEERVLEAIASSRDAKKKKNGMA